MIKLVDNLPALKSLTAEYIKIRCLFDCYKDDKDVLFWTQEEKAVFSLSDGNMTILNMGADLDEVKEFVSLMGPNSVFSDYNTLSKLGLDPKEKVCVMHKKALFNGCLKGDEFSSKDMYDILSVEGLNLPEYPFFAVDFCRRKNHGGLEYFGIKNKCGAVCFKSGNLSLLNGIASHQKGYGSIALKSALQQNYGKDFLVCCRDSVMDFYRKNGFEKLYNAGYWVKKNEYK